MDHTYGIILINILLQSNTNVYVDYYHKVPFNRAYDLIESFPSTAVNYIKANERLNLGLARMRY